MTIQLKCPVSGTLIFCTLTTPASRARHEPAWAQFATLAYRSLIFKHCPLFHCRFIALKSRTFVVKSRTTFAIKFVRDLNAKSTPMGDCGRGCLGRGAPQGICDPSLGRASQTQFRKHRRSGKSTGPESQYSLQTLAAVRRRPQTSSLLPYFPGSAVASRMSPSWVMNYRTVRRRAEAVDARTVISRREGAALMSSISDLSVHPSLEVRQRFAGRSLAVPN
jgi:hypothetical protein